MQPTVASVRQRAVAATVLADRAVGLGNPLRRDANVGVVARGAADSFSKNRSVTFTEDGFSEAGRLFRNLFAAPQNLPLEPRPPPTLSSS